MTGTGARTFEDGEPVEAVYSWGGRTSGGFEMHMYPGGHFCLTDRMPRVVAAVSRQIPSLLT